LVLINNSINKGSRINLPTNLQVPNDEICEIEIVRQEKDSIQFYIHGSNVNDEATTTDVNVFIKAKSICPINSKIPEVRITD
jgi:hypothetical protein